jgi:hypothetical protein
VSKSFRGRPLGGLFHAVFSLDLGTTRRCVNRTLDRQKFYSEHPSTSIRGFEPPTANIDGRESRIVMRRQWGSPMLLLRQAAGTVLAKPTTTYDSPR